MDIPSTTSRNVKRVHREWPSSRIHAQNGALQMVANNQTPKSTNTKWVTVYIGEQRRILFTNTGSRFTLITPDMYYEEVGKVLPVKYGLRAWGSN